MKPFAAGASVAWRNCPRIDATRIEHPSFAIAMTVVQDTPEVLALYRKPGYPMRRRNAERGGGNPDFRHPPVIRWLDGWSDETWGPPWRVLVLKPPAAGHAISLFWTDASNELAFWYIDLIGPVRRRTFGFDFPEHGLDVVVEPDLSSWRWKDEDELEWAVEAGIYSRAEADELHAEGALAVERLVHDAIDFDRWRNWRPDPGWPVATFPPGSDAV